MPSISATRMIQIGIIASVLILVGVITWHVFQPQKMEWVSVSSPSVEPEKLTISAETRRRPMADCTNGPEMDLRKDGELVRLPVPTRTIRGNISTYETVLVEPLAPGRYAIRLRESFLCPGLTQVIESPAIEFDVK